MLNSELIFHAFLKIHLFWNTASNEIHIFQIGLFRDMVSFRYRSHTAEHEAETPAIPLFKAWLHIGMLSAIKPVMRKLGEARVSAPDTKSFILTFRATKMCGLCPAYLHFPAWLRERYQWQNETSILLCDCCLDAWNQPHKPCYLENEATPNVKRPNILS